MFIYIGWIMMMKMGIMQSGGSWWYIWANFSHGEEDHDVEAFIILSLSSWMWITMMKMVLPWSRVECGPWWWRWCCHQAEWRITMTKLGVKIFTHGLFSMFHKNDQCSRITIDSRGFTTQISKFLAVRSLL